MSSAVGDTVRVLIVEDDPADAELTVAELERSGMRVLAQAVSTRRQLEDRLDTGTYDIVLADYQLGDWRGTDVLPILSARGLDIPLLLVTGTLGEERVVECMKAGATDCVFKRNLSSLPLAIRRALDERRLRRERAESRDTIRKLSLAVDQSPASVLITNAQGTIEYVNRRFTEITGYQPEEAIGRNPRILGSGRTPPDTYERMWEALRAGRVWRGELQNRRKSGDVYWDEVTISPLRDGTGTITHYVGVQEDVSERRWAEQALREREERFRQIADNIREVFFIVDTDFQQTLYLNPAYETIWGRSVQSAYEDPTAFMDGVVAEDRPALIASIERIRAGSEVEEIEFRVRRPDGEVRWVRSQAVPVRDAEGRAFRICGAVLDVTDRRHTEERLRESEERFRKLVDASFDAVILVQDGLIREVNAGFERVWGYSAEEAVGRPVKDLIAPESWTEVQRRIADAIEGRYSLVGVTNDGRHIRLEATARNHEFEGRPGRITALRDVTEVRALEEQFHQAQKMEAVGRLAGGIAHDFNNLLTVIASYTDLALGSLPPDAPATSDIRQAKQAALDAAFLTRQLLAFSRRQTVEPQVLVLEEFIAEAGKMLERVLSEDIELVISPSEHPNAVLIDPSQLQQALLNLAVNAKDAMPFGGTLTIETRGVTLDDEYADVHWPATPGRYVMLSVTDDGVGMDEATQARVFEPFFTTKEAGKGTGLGLASVYGIVKQNDGFIWVYSEPGRGTTFKIYMPRAESPETNEAPTGEASRPRTEGTETVLIAEDEAGVRNAMRQILERAGYTVLEAPRPDVALHLAASHAVDLLITDLIMPEMTGGELAEAFREHHPGARVLYMSGYSDDMAVRSGGVPPGSDFLQKPFSADGLTRTVREVLDGGGGG